MSDNAAAAAATDNTDDTAAADAAAVEAAAAAAAENSDDAAAAAASDEAGKEGKDLPPDTYADFVLPEGTQLDETVLAEANPVFKGLELSQEKAQKVVDLYTKLVQAGSVKQVESFEQLKTGWRKSAETDKEYGGEKFEENSKIAQLAVTKYGTPELKQALEETGMGNHPEFIRAFLKIGRTLKEDVPGNTDNATSKSQSRVEILYPKDS